MIRDERTSPQNDSPNLRKGRFLWMDGESQRRYLSELTRRIHNGFFFSDDVIEGVVDELAPVFGDAADGPRG